MSIYIYILWAVDLELERYLRCVIFRFAFLWSRFNFERRLETDLSRVIMPHSSPLWIIKWLSIPSQIIINYFPSAFLIMFSVCVQIVYVFCFDNVWLSEKYPFQNRTDIYKNKIYFVKITNKMKNKIQRLN